MGKVKNNNNNKKQKRHNATGMQTAAEVLADEALQSVPVETILPLIQKVMSATCHNLPWCLHNRDKFGPLKAHQEDHCFVDSSLPLTQTSAPGLQQEQATC